MRIQKRIVEMGRAADAEFELHFEFLAAPNNRIEQTSDADTVKL